MPVEPLSEEELERVRQKQVGCFENETQRLLATIDREREAKERERDARGEYAAAVCNERRRAEQAEAQCAAMRDALEGLRDYVGDVTWERAQISKGLAFDAGTKLLARMRALEAVIKALGTCQPTGLLAVALDALDKVPR